MTGESIRVTGIVQGVGFRPTVWRLARECGVVGEVWNDAEGVLIHAWGSPESLEQLVLRLQADGWQWILLEGGVPVACVGAENSMNAGLLAVRILALNSQKLQKARNLRRNAHSQSYRDFRN